MSGQPVSPKSAGLPDGGRTPRAATKDAHHISLTDSHGDRCVVTTRDHFPAEGRAVQIRCATKIEGDWVILDEAQARELFNWLGVYLHKQGSTE